MDPRLFTRDRPFSRLSGAVPVRAPEGVKQGAQGVLWAEVVQVARYGARASLLLSGAGLLLAAGLLLLPGVPLAVTGFALTGLAVAGIVPTTLSAAGRLAPGHSGAVSGGLMAAVYLAFTVTPPLVGWLAERASLQAALLVVGLSGAGILGLTLGAGAGRGKNYSR
jgi:MFS family permease